MESNQGQDVLTPRKAALRHTPVWQALGGLLLFCYGYVWHNPGPNEQSRLNLVYAIAFHGKLNVDEYRDNTIDMALHDGHYYSDKAPGLSFVAAPIMFALRPIYERVEATRRMRFLLTVYLPRFFAVSLPSAAFAVLLFAFMKRAGAGERFGVVLALSYGLGTLALPYSALFYGHQLGAALGCSAFMLLVVTKHSPRALWPCAAAGALAGCAVVAEYPMAAVASILGLYTVFTRRRVGPAAAYGLAALAPVSGLLAYHAACFGHPFAFGYQFEKIARFKEHHAQGLLGATSFRWRHVFDATLSPARGVFFLSPALLLAPWGWWRMLRGRAWRAEAVASIAILAVFLAFVSTLWEESYLYAPGHRHMIPVLPFAALALAFCPRGLRPLITLLGAWGVVQMVLINFVDPRAPETLHMSLPFFQFFAPRFFAGQLDYNWGVALGLRGLASSLPFWVGSAGLASVLAGALRRAPGAPIDDSSHEE